jgi:hypothetical protein
MVQFGVSLNNVRCVSCGSQANVLGAVENKQGRVFQQCQCDACLLTFDRITSPNGKGVTTLYAVPSLERTRKVVRVVPGSREDAHAS